MANVVLKHDLIESFTLPDGWREFEIPDQGYTVSTVREFRPADSVNDSTSLTLYNRGLEMQYAATFKNLLAEPDHHLTQAETERLEELLGDAADPERFSVLDARTEILNGRRALIVEGRWINSQTDMIRVYLDIRGDGRFAQEVIFSAPIKEYESHIQAVRACLRSIIWQA